MENKPSTLTEHIIIFILFYNKQYHMKSIFMDTLGRGYIWEIYFNITKVSMSRFPFHICSLPYNSQSSSFLSSCQNIKFKLHFK